MIYYLRGYIHYLGGILLIHGGLKPRYGMRKMLSREIGVTVVMDVQRCFCSKSYIQRKHCFRRVQILETDMYLDKRLHISSSTPLPLTVESIIYMPELPL